MEKIVMVSNSQGERGDNGKKKVYEITLEGDLWVVLSWGMAEKSARQIQRKWFPNPYTRAKFVEDKKWEKIAKGYTTAYTA